MYLIPEMPCEPTSLPFSRFNSIIIDTYNAKITYILAFIMLFVQIDIMLVSANIKMFKTEKKKITKGSKIGFSILTGIDESIVYDWGNNVNKLSSESSKIYKKLNQFREESLSNKLATGNKNPVGILAILNRHYQWNMPGVSREQANKSALTAAELPQLGTPQTPQIKGIADNSGDNTV